MLPWPARAADDLPARCQAWPIQKVVVDGCFGRWCEAPGEREKLVSLTDLETGRPFEARRVAAGAARLEKTGFFEQVSAGCVLDPKLEGAVVVFTVRPNRWIRRVRVEGNKAIFESDILKRLDMRPGTAWNPESDAGRKVAAAQSAAIVKQYRRKGYDRAQVTISPKPVDAEWVDLRITVVEGRRAKVNAVEVVLKRTVPETVEHPFGPQIRCAPITRRSVLRAADIDIGEVFTVRREREVRRKVSDYLRGRGYLDIGRDVRFDASTGVVRVEVAVERCWVIRFYTRSDPAPGLEGYEPADAEALYDVLPFRHSGTFDVLEAERARVALEQYHQSHGYLFSDVRMEHRSADRPRSAPGVQGVVTLFSTLNYVNEIRSITIHGNRALSDEELRAVMQTQTYDFFGTGGFLVQEQVFADLARIRKTYRDKGFGAMGYPGVRPPYGDRIVGELRRRGSDEVYVYTLRDLQFEVHKDPRESVIYLHIRVEEGPEVVVDDLDLCGPSREDAVALRQRLGLQPGGTFSPTRVEENRLGLVRWYQERGFHGVQVRPLCWQPPAGVPPPRAATACADLPESGALGRYVEDCGWSTVKAGPARIRYAIRPGDRTTIGERFVRGNWRTSPPIILNELPKPGEPLSQAALLSAERRLRRLGIFSGVEIQLVGLDERPRRKRAAIVVVVEERRAQFLDLALGFESISQGRARAGSPELSSSITNAAGVVDSAVRGPRRATPVGVGDLLFTVEVAYRHRNFLGRAIELLVPLKYGFTTPVSVDALHRFAKLSATLYEPFLFGSDYSLALTPFARYDRATKIIDEIEAGGELRLGKTFFKHLRSSITFTASGIQSRDPARTADFGAFEPKLDVDVVATLDYLDNPANPTKGFAIGLRLSYINKREDDTFKNFLKWEATGKLFLNVRGSLIIGLYFRYADSFSIDSDRLPDVERYRLGSLNDNRGFDDDAIRPVDSSGVPLDTYGGDSLLSGSIELRFPIVRRLNLWGAGFFDFGGLAESTTEFNRHSIRTSVGVGLRYLLFGQVPIRFDFGINIDRRCVPSPQGCLVPEDFGKAHFGILYPF